MAVFHGKRPINQTFLKCKLEKDIIFHYTCIKNLYFIETIGQSFIFNVTKNYKSKFEYQ